MCFIFNNGIETMADNVAQLSCGAGGTYCDHGKSCIQNNTSGQQIRYCVSGSCLNDPLTTCQFPSKRLIPCGSGGTLCFEASICITNDNSKICSTEDCISNNQSSCKSLSVLPCSKGGVACPNNQICAQPDFTPCPAGDFLCMKSTSNVCIEPEKIACGHGGVACPVGSNTVCVKGDESGLCQMGESCVQKVASAKGQEGSMCAAVTVLPCGKGGTSCKDANQLCILNDKSNICLEGDCLNNGATCQNPNVLPCGKGGFTCGANEVCTLADRATACTSGDCMKLLTNICTPQNNLPCGSGGTYCSDENQVCALADGSKPCKNSDSCISLSNNQCLNKTALPCGFGGLSCDKEQQCVLSDNVTPVKLDQLNLMDNKCISLEKLPCEKGGLVCANNDMCAVPDKTSKATVADGKTPNVCVKPEQLPCGKGGKACGDNQVCSLADKSALVDASSFDKTDNVCIPLEGLPCGKGGSVCGSGQTCVLGDKSGIVQASDFAKTDNQCSVLDVLPCGKGGLSCSGDTKCADVSGRICNSVTDSCANDNHSQCLVSSKLACGAGGTYCQDGSVCAKSDASSICHLGEACVANGATCLAYNAVPCSRGGTKCNANTNPLKLNLCATPSGSLCSTPDCMSASTSQCVEFVAPTVLCGKGGSMCLDAEEICMLNDYSNLCNEGQTCIKNTTAAPVCKNPIYLPIYLGGLRGGYTLDANKFAGGDGSKPIAAVSLPSAIAFNKLSATASDAYIADNFRHYISVVKSTATTPVTIQPTNVSNLVVADMAIVNKMLYVLDSANKKVWKYDIDKSTWTDLAPIGLAVTNADILKTGLFMDNAAATPSSMFVANDGSIFITTYNATVTPSVGSLIKYTLVNGKYSPTVIEKQFKEPSGVVGDSKGNIYVIDRVSKQLIKYDPSESVVPNAPVNYVKTVLINVSTLMGDCGNFSETQLLEPVDIAIDGNDNLYIAEKSATPHIRMVSLKYNKVSTVIGKNNLGRTSCPYNNVNDALKYSFDMGGPKKISVDSNNQLYVVDGNIAYRFIPTLKQ